MKKSFYENVLLELGTNTENANVLFDQSNAITYDHYSIYDRDDELMATLKIEYVRDDIDEQSFFNDAWLINPETEEEYKISEKQANELLKFENN